MSSSQPVACSLTDPELGRRLESLRNGLFARTRAVRYDDAGVAFVFEGSDQHVDELLEIVALERRCCPFLHFRVEIAPLPGDLVLHLGGSAEALAFIRDTFVTLVPQESQSTS
jgi:hypothetical protein